MMKNKSKFFYAMLIMSAVFVAVIVTVFVVLWSFLSEYQKSVPLEAANQYIEEIKSGNYEKAMQLANVDSSKISVEQYTELVKQALGNSVDSLNTYQATGSTANKPVIEVKSSNAKGIVFDLQEKTGELKFKLKTYSLNQRLSEPKTYKVVADNDADVNVNGASIKQLAEPVLTQIKGFEGIKKTEIIPKTAVYTIENMYVKPEITADNITVKFDEKTATFTVKNETQPADTAQYQELTIQSAKEYAKFVSGDSNMKKLAKYAYTETDFYKALSSYSSYWYIDHEKVDFENVKVNNIVEYSKDAFSAEIRFDYMVYLNKDKVNKYPTAYKISFLKQNNKYMAASILPIQF